MNLPCATRSWSPGMSVAVHPAGFVYGNHDIDIAYYRANLFGAQGFLNLVRHSPDAAAYTADVNAAPLLATLLETK